MPDIRPLPPDLQKIAIDELHEVPERLAEDIEALKTWIQQQPHLKARTSDQFLVSFLRGCKFSLEKAKSKIDKFYTLRTKFPDFYTIQNPDDPCHIEMMRFGIGLNLPTPLHENGPRIMLIRAGCYPASQYSFDQVMCMAHTLTNITIIDDDYANINGVIDIIDLSQVTTAHMLQMTPTVMKKMSVFAEDALPLRQKGTHLIYAPSGFEKLFNLLKPLMPIKQQERLYVHPSLEELHKHIPPKYLPKEYGGENGTVAELIDSGVKAYLSYKDFFIEDLNYVTDEKLRPGKTTNYDDIFGIDGSFRKLNVD